jgi:hypothetical protein
MRPGLLNGTEENEIHQSNDRGSLVLFAAWVYGGGVSQHTSSYNAVDNGP